MEKEFIFVDHLKEHMKELVTQYINAHKDSLPSEFTGIPDEKLIYSITNEAVPVLRKIEGDALEAGIGRFASLIRYSQRRDHETCRTESKNKS